MKKTIIILTHVIFDNSPYCIFVHEHAKALKQQGYNVIVFAILNWIPFAGFLKKERKKHYKEKNGIKIIDGVTVIYKKRLSFSNLFIDSKINLNGISYYLTIKNMIRKIAKENDILFIDAHMFKVEGYVASLLHKKFGFKATVTCHGNSLIKTTEYKNSKYIVSQIMDNINYAVCVSNSLENRLKKYGYNNTKVIYNGINFYDIEKNICTRENTIITVATLIKRKNVDLVIEAFQKVHEKFEDKKLVIVGQGIEETKLKQEVKRLGIEGSVSFLGQRSNEEVHKLMQKSKIFILPSINEGFGIVYAEAMKNGCITIGTKNEGIDGFIKDGINGFLVKPELDDIISKLYYILENEREIDKIIECGIKDAENLSWDNNAKEYIKLFEN